MPGILRRHAHLGILGILRRQAHQGMPGILKKTGSPRYGRIAEPAKPVAAKRTAPPPITPKPFTAKKTGF